MNLAENVKIVPLLTSADIGANTDLDSINMAGFKRAVFVFTCGACTGSVTFAAYSGATEGAKTTAVPFRYALGGAAIGTAVANSTASCDVLAATTKTTADTPTVAIACTTKMVVIEIDSIDMDQSNGHNWLTINVAATAGIVHAVAILEGGYQGNRSATVLK